MLYEVRFAANKGLGLFAKHKIPCGTRIVAEKPLITLREGQRPTDVLSSAEQLNGKDRKRLLELSSYRGSGIKRLGRWSEALRWVVRDRRTAHERRDESNDRETLAIMPVSMRRVMDDLIEAYQILSIFRSNSFNLASATKSSSIRDQSPNNLSKSHPTPSAPVAAIPSVDTINIPLPASPPYELALFPTIARINHSCVPNAQANYHTLHQTFNIHATRDIPMGDEVSINYLPEVGQLREQRIAKLEEGYGFTCNCLACDLSTNLGIQGEKNRKYLQEKIKAIQPYLTERIKNVGVGYSVDGMPETLECVAPDHMEQSMGTMNHLSEKERQSRLRHYELEVNRSMLDMYRKEGIVGREVASIYYRLAYLQCGDGSVEDALVNARTGLRLEEDCLGADHPEYFHALASVERVRKLVNLRLSNAQGLDQEGL